MSDSRSYDEPRGAMSSSPPHGTRPAPARDLPWWCWVGWHLQVVFDPRKPDFPVISCFVTPLGSDPDVRKWERADAISRMTELCIIPDLPGAIAALAEGCCPIHRYFPAEDWRSSIIRAVPLERDGDAGWCSSCWFSYRLQPTALEGSLQALDVFLDPEERRRRHLYEDPRAAHVR